MKSQSPDHIFHSPISYVFFRDFLCTCKYISMHMCRYKPHKIHTDKVLVLLLFKVLIKKKEYMQRRALGAV